MNEPTPLLLFFDYVDPSSYLLHHRLLERGLRPGEGYFPLPFEVNPPPNPLLDPQEGEWKDRWDRALVQAPEMGLPLVRPRIVPWTRKAHELLFHASETASPAEIHESLFRTYLIEGRDIGRVDVLTALAGEHGLDPNDSRAVLDVDRYRPPLERIRAQGIRAGVTTVPFLQAGAEILRGHPTEEELDAFLASLVDEKQP